MSDYLWDKSGEPEEDVERLEELLGTLRYQPRPLEMPADFSAQTARGKFRPQRQFTWQRLALAASLLLTLLAGAWLVRWQHSNELQREAARKQQPEQRQQAAPVKQAPPAQNEQASAPPNEQSTPKRVAPANIDRAGYRRPQRAPLRTNLAMRHRASPAPQKTTHDEQLARDNAPQELTPEQRAAAEQLMLALRIASAKLNYAERQVQEISAARKPEIR